jgi:hypothetical protein
MSKDSIDQNTPSASPRTVVVTVDRAWRGPVQDDVPEPACSHVAGRAVRRMIVRSASSLIGLAEFRLHLEQEPWGPWRCNHVRAFLASHHLMEGDLIDMQDRTGRVIQRLQVMPDAEGVIRWWPRTDPHVAGADLARDHGGWGPEGAADAPASGAPPALTETFATDLLAAIEAGPASPLRLLALDDFIAKHRLAVGDLITITDGTARTARFRVERGLAVVEAVEADAPGEAKPTESAGLPLRGQA